MYIHVQRFAKLELIHSKIFKKLMSSTARKSIANFIKVTVNRNPFGLHIRLLHFCIPSIPHNIRLDQSDWSADIFFTSLLHLFILHNHGAVWLINKFLFFISYLLSV